MRVTKQDRARIAEAIATAESKTSGEVFCVISRRVSSYYDVSLAWAGAAALLLPLAMIPFGISLELLFTWLDPWRDAHTTRAGAVTQSLAIYALTQALVFIAVFLLTRIPPIRRLVTPARVRRYRVRKAALQQFMAHGVHVTRERTGVLIFASIDEHMVELIADQAIHSKVDPEVWGEAVAVLARRMKQGQPVAGFEAAIERCGLVLAEHFPPGETNPNELPDHLILL